MPGSIGHDVTSGIGQARRITNVRANATTAHATSATRKGTSVADVRMKKTAIDGTHATSQRDQKAFVNGVSLNMSRNPIGAGDSLPMSWLYPHAAPTKRGDPTAARGAGDRSCRSGPCPSGPHSAHRPMGQDCVSTIATADGPAVLDRTRPDLRGREHSLHLARSLTRDLR